MELWNRVQLSPATAKPQKLWTMGRQWGNYHAKISPRSEVPGTAHDDKTAQLSYVNCN